MKKKAIKKPKTVKNPAPEKPLHQGAISPRYRNRKSLSDWDCFIFTTAQNNTPVHAKFFTNLETYAKHKNARLIVGKMLYNLHAFQKAGEADEVWFDPAVMPYMLPEQALVCDGLVWCGDCNILPTATWPLSGFQGYVKQSCIFPASTIQLESVATSKGNPAKLMYSTGACTQRNYTSTKAGNLGDARQSFGALIVEVDRTENLWFVRQIETNENGEFQDLLTQVKDGNVCKLSKSISAVNLGDIHAEKIDYEVFSACLDMLNTLEPIYTVCHDVLDFENSNHHNRDSHLHRAEESVKGGSVQKNLEKVAEVLHELVNTDSQVVIVESNHDEAMSRWIDSCKHNFMNDTSENAIVYLKLQLLQFQSIRDTGKRVSPLLPAALELLVPDIELVNKIFLSVMDSFIVEGTELAYHGHNGIGGSRGSAKQYCKLGIPITLGHSHSATICQQVYQAGCMNLNQGYNEASPSSWSISHVIQYCNGFRTVITMQKDSGGAWKWCA